MISTIFIAFGLVLIIEGLAFALAPSRIHEMLKILSELPAEKMRQIGLIAISLGVVLVIAANRLVL